MFNTSQLPTVFFFVFALFESLTLSVRMQYRRCCASDSHDVGESESPYKSVLVLQAQVTVILLYKSICLI